MKFLTSMFLGVGLASAMPQPLPGSWSSTQSSDIHQLSKRSVPQQENGLEARSLPMCNHDNLFRIFLDARYSSSASAFCSTYITSTSVSTIMPLTTTIVNAIKTDATAFSTVIVLATVTSTIPAPDATITVNAKAKRLALVGCPGKAGTYPPDRISSACSCLVTPAVILSTTTTAALSTVALASTVHVTKVATTVKYGTTLVNIAGLPTATSTIRSGPPPVLCSPSLFQSGREFTIQCGISYITGNQVPDNTITATSYQDCASSCSDDANCSAFSFSTSVPIPGNNCNLFYRSPGSSNVDPTFISGY